MSFGDENKDNIIIIIMFCNVVLYCIALPARVLFAIKIIIIIKRPLFQSY